jgi:4-amino-4-deoxy-L-arabinose transferase-like glycosyltransferase
VGTLGAVLDWRLVVASVAVAVAMLVKHTALVMVPSAVLIVILHAWRCRDSVRRTFNRIAAAAIVVAFSIWALCGFDFSRPTDLGYFSGIRYDKNRSFMRMIEPAMSLRWPAGVYLSSLINGLDHVRSGHEAYLWGQHSRQGWWYYYPAVAMYKVPIGIMLVMVLGLASLLWRRPRWEELGLFIPALACGAVIVGAGVNVGFRHALPVWGLMLMLASRCVAEAHVIVKGLAWLGVAGAAIHVSMCHPDYIAYINGPWDKPYLAISDSNIDWGQSLPAVAKWLDTRPKDDPRVRPIWLDVMETAVGKPVDHYLDHRVNVVGVDSTDPPTRGLLIVSPWWIAGLYGRGDRYASLRDQPPIDVIGHNLLVYDLDRIRLSPSPGTPGEGRGEGSSAK